MRPARARAVRAPHGDGELAAVTSVICARARAARSPASVARRCGWQLVEAVDRVVERLAPRTTASGSARPARRGAQSCARDGAATRASVCLRGAQLPARGCSLRRAALARPRVEAREVAASLLKAGLEGVELDRLRGAPGGERRLALLEHADARARAATGRGTDQREQEPRARQKEACSGDVAPARPRRPYRLLPAQYRQRRHLRTLRASVELGSAGGISLQAFCAGFWLIYGRFRLPASETAARVPSLVTYRPLPVRLSRVVCGSRRSAPQRQATCVFSLLRVARRSLPPVRDRRAAVDHGKQAEAQRVLDEIHAARRPAGAGDRGVQPRDRQARRRSSASRR